MEDWKHDRRAALGRYFLQLVRRMEVDERTGCWIAGQRPASDGYRQLHVRGHGKILAHRLSYELFNHEHPGKMLVLHKCHNPACFRPDHLKLGTNQDNANDKVAAGRTRNQHAEGPGWQASN